MSRDKNPKHHHKEYSFTNKKNKAGESFVEAAIKKKDYNLLLTFEYATKDRPDTLVKY